MASFVIAAAVDTGIGVSSPYWGPENPLKVYPGESAIVTMTLGSAPGASDTYFKAEVTEDGDGIASLNQPKLTYFVKGGTQVPVPIIINVPSSASIGSKSKVNIMFTEVSPDNKYTSGGSIQLNGAVSNGFPVEVVKREQSTFYNPELVEVVEKESNASNWIILILALVIIYLATASSRKKKKK